MNEFANAAIEARKYMRMETPSIDWVSTAIKALDILSNTSKRPAILEALDDALATESQYGVVASDPATRAPDAVREIERLLSQIDEGRPANVSVEAWRAFAEYPPRTEEEAAALRAMIDAGLFAPSPTLTGGGDDQS